MTAGISKSYKHLNTIKEETTMKLVFTTLGCPD